MSDCKRFISLIFSSEPESKPGDGSQSENTERRSSRIMTRKQRDSELRLQFAKKLKSNAQSNNSQPGAKRKELPKTPVRYIKSDLNTSDSETPTLEKKVVAKKPLLTNKRKSSLEYNESRKRLRKEADTTTTSDDNDDTEESDHKPTVKRKPNQNSKVAKLVKKMKDDFSDETDDSETNSDLDLEEDIKKAISTKFPSYKNLNSTNTNTTNSKNSSRPQPTTVKKPIGSVNKPTSSLQKTTMGKPKQNDIISNVSNVNMFANNTNGKKIDSLKIGKSSDSNKPQSKAVNNIRPNSKSSTSASPRLKSEFDKLVDELFENESTKKRKEPELMIINNEPTDVYFLSVDDTLEDEDDLENLESLCEEVYEDDILPPKPIANPTMNFGPKPKIIDINKPIRSAPQPMSSLKKEIYKPEVKPHLNNNNINHMHTKQAPQTSQNRPLTKTLVLPKTPATPNYSTTNKPSNTPSVSKPNTPSAASKPTPGKQTVKPTYAVTETHIDYKEKYNKLHTSYEALSRKIAQFMDKTKKEKESLKRQLRIEKNKCAKAQDDLDNVKRKFQYLMTNRPSTKKKK